MQIVAYGGTDKSTQSHGSLKLVLFGELVANLYEFVQSHLLIFLLSAFTPVMVMFTKSHLVFL